jgi:hypothetical protein
MKLITNLLQDELESLKQPSRVNPSEVNTWSNAKPSKSVGTKAAITTYGSPYMGHQYTVPVSNRFAALPTHLEPRTPMDSTSYDQLQDNPNLQAPVMNGDGSGPIPVVVNGVISTNLNPIHKHIDSDLTCNSTTLLINNLRESINILSKMKLSPSKKHKIVLNGDSHVRGYASMLKPLLNSDYDLFCGETWIRL